MGIDIDKAIMRAAHDVVMQHGLQGTTMTAVAKGAGISRPTLYARFSGKQAVLSKLLTHELLCVVASIERHPETGEQLLDSLMKAVSGVTRNPVVNIIVEEQPDLMGNYFFRRLGESQVRLIAALEHMIRNLQLRAPATICARDPHVLATTCFSVLQHFAISARIFEPVIRAQHPESTWERELRHLLEGYLLP